MPSGSVIEYRGKRGLVFRVKYRDADGKQVQETVGAERDGWTRKKAEAELRERLVRVERRGYRRPRRLRFDAYADTWFEEGKTRRGWKPTGKVCCGPKVPARSPSSTLIVRSTELATTRSGLPSPLTSATATERGAAPTANVC